MTRRRPKSEAVAVSLFPFLAVLLCTMGALIVLLVMLSLQAKETVEAAPPPPPPAVDEEALERYEELLARAAALDDERAALIAQLETRAKVIKDLDIEGTKLEEELESLDALRGQMRNNDESDVTEAQLKANLTWYENKLFEKEGELRKIRQRVAENPVSYAIVPYTGDSGTFQRPLYIECSEEGVILQPEGVVLRADDFTVLAANNPLVSAIRETTDYWRSRGRSARGEAYPLLLVRPNGALAFHAAKTALEFWSGDFGYELIEENWNLEFSQPDPELARRQARAVDNARRVLANLSHGGSGLIAQATRPSFRVATQGSLEPVSPGSGGSGQGNGANSRENGLGGGQSSGSQAGAKGTSTGLAGAAGGTDRYGNPLPGASGNGSTGDGMLGGGVAGDNRYGQAGGTGSDTAGLAGNSFGGNPNNAAGPSGIGTGGQGSGDSLLVGGNGTGPRDPLSPMFAGNAGGQDTSSQYGAGQSSGLNGSGLGGTGQFGSPQLGSGGDPQGQGGTGQAGSALTGMGAPGTAGSLGHEPNKVTGGAVANPDGDGATNYVGMANPANDSAWRQNGAGGPMQNGGMAGATQQAGAGQGAMQPGALNQSVTNAGTPQSPGSFGQPGTTFSQGATGAQAGSAGSPASSGNFSFSPGGSSGGGGRPGMGTGAGGEHREANWALPNAGVGNVAVSRMMKVTLDANTLTVYPKDPQWQPDVVRLQPNTQDSLDDFRIAVWREMDRWGLAGRGMYWKPILKFEVTPDGADRYFELKQMMENSGFVLESQRVLPPSRANSSPAQNQPQRNGPLIIRPADNFRSSGRVQR